MVLISFPLKAELQFFIEAIKNDGLNVTTENKRGPFVHLCTDLDWILAHGGHGKTQFAIQTQNIIHHYPEIKKVLVSGACGALVDNLKMGDVIVATKTIEHDYKERFIPQPLPNFEACPELLHRFQTHAPHAHFGIIASGDEDVVDHQRAQELRSQTQAIAVAWEGAGGARTSKFHKLPFIEVRAVTDSANTNAITDFKNNLKIAMHAIYKTLHATLKTL